MKNGPKPARPAARIRPRRLPGKLCRTRARHPRVPAFAPVPLRARADGWTPMRQAAFLAALALTGSVCAAARRVGLARETAYRLRRKPGAGSFAAAWDAVLGRAAPARRKVTAGERAQRALSGLLKPLIYRGRHVATIEKADNSALLGHMARLAAGERPPRPQGGGDSAGGLSFGGRPASTGEGAPRHPMRGEARGRGASFAAVGYPDSLC